MSRGDSLRELLARYQSGDETAAAELHHLYAQRLCALAENKMGPWLRRREDPEDPVQSAFRSFFRRAARGEFQIDHSGSLWHLLVKITLNKIRKHAEYHTAGKRDVRREFQGDGDELRPEAIAHDPTPEEANAWVDIVQSVLAELPPRAREVLDLRIKGHTTPEIADRLGCTRWTVRRGLDRIGQQLQRRLAVP
jgi:RNA polymerase sigma factor (sigma-70 family)